MCTITLMGNAINTRGNLPEAGAQVPEIAQEPDYGKALATLA